jgi:hypothetical protein
LKFKVLDGNALIVIFSLQAEGHKEATELVVKGEDTS